MTAEEYDSLPFLTSEDDWPPAVIVEREPRNHRHVWIRDQGVPGTNGGIVTRCAVCVAIQDPVKSRRGKNNRKRGLSLQLTHARRLGLDNLQGNGATDARSESQYGNAAFVAQMKSGGMFPGWMQRELDYLPRTGGRTPILVVIETPGPGRKARAVVVVDEADWIQLHGPAGEADRG